MACASGVRGLCVGQCVVFNFAIKVVFPEMVFTNFQGTLGGANRFPQGIPRGPFRGFPDAPPGGPSIGDKGKPQQTPWGTTTWVSLGDCLLVCFWDSYGGSLKHDVETWNHKQGRPKAAPTDVWGAPVEIPRG